MLYSSWVLVDKPKPEKKLDVEISLKYRESDELLAQKLQDTEIRRNVTYIEAKHIPNNAISNKSIHSETGKFVFISFVKIFVCTH